MLDDVVEGYKEYSPSITPTPERSLKKRARGSSGVESDDEYSEAEAVVDLDLLDINPTTQVEEVEIIPPPVAIQRILSVVTNGSTESLVDSNPEIRNNLPHAKISPKVHEAFIASLSDENASVHDKKDSLGEGGCLFLGGASASDDI